ncbi:MAG: hypothetical protein EOM20_10065 [Spartobacteria bacterium]|nr:hypothetical protein [Spartobacteria bacterium]
MEFTLTVMFPMSIDASPLFRQIHRMAADWRAEVDLTKVAGRNIARLRDTRPPPIPTLQDVAAKKGRHINIVA